jgi:hypothetical protein
MNINISSKWVRIRKGAIAKEEGAMHSFEDNKQDHPSFEIMRKKSCDFLSK